MIARRALIAMALIGLALIGASPAEATDAKAASQFIDNLGKQAFATLQSDSGSLGQREADFAKILRQGFDLNLIARFVLGKYWRQATPEEQSEYLAVFSAYVIQTYARRLGGFSGQSFTITGTKVTGDKQDILVDTRIDQKSGAPIQAAWRVRNIGGQLKIIDVVVEGVSMAVTQRQEFASVAQSGGIEGLLQRLRAQTERLSAASG